MKKFNSKSEAHAWASETDRILYQAGHHDADPRTIIHLDIEEGHIDVLERFEEFEAKGEHDTVVILVPVFEVVVVRRDDENTYETYDLYDGLRRAWEARTPASL